MTVPFLDLRAAYDELRVQIDESVSRVLRSGWYILGSEVSEFEQEYASYCGASHCVGVGNGLEALHLGLLALGVGPGDEVIVPAHTYIATWLAVSQCGAIPVAVEPNDSTYNIDADAIASVVTSRTKAIVPVHMYGQPADLDAIAGVALEHGLPVLEDAAQAHGARYKGERIGSHGNVVAWSFYPGKNLGAMGDGGAVTTDDAEIAERIRSLGNYGSQKKYVHDYRGFNSRLDPIQASVLRVKLKYLEEWNRRRSDAASAYLKNLADIDLVLPTVPAWAEPVWHLFVIRHARRDTLSAQLKDAGIGSLVHYPIPPYLQRAYADFDSCESDFPISTRMSEEVLSLPIGPHLSAEQVDEVISILREVAGSDPT